MASFDGWCTGSCPVKEGANGIPATVWGMVGNWIVRLPTHTLDNRKNNIGYEGASVQVPNIVHNDVEYECVGCAASMVADFSWQFALHIARQYVWFWTNWMPVGKPYTFANRHLAKSGFTQIKVLDGIFEPGLQPLKCELTKNWIIDDRKWGDEKVILNGRNEYPVDPWLHLPIYSCASIDPANHTDRYCTVGEDIVAWHDKSSNPSILYYYEEGDTSVRTASWTNMEFDVSGSAWLAVKFHRHAFPYCLAMKVDFGDYIWAPARMPSMNGKPIDMSGQEFIELGFGYGAIPDRNGTSTNPYFKIKDWTMAGGPDDEKPSSYPANGVSNIIAIFSADTNVYDDPTYSHCSALTEASIHIGEATWWDTADYNLTYMMPTLAPSAQYTPIAYLYNYVTYLNLPEGSTDSMEVMRPTPFYTSWGSYDDVALTPYLSAQIIQEPERLNNDEWPPNLYTNPEPDSGIANLKDMIVGGGILEYLDQHIMPSGWSWDSSVDRTARHDSWAILNRGFYAGWDATNKGSVLLHPFPKSEYIGEDGYSYGLPLAIHGIFDELTGTPEFYKGLAEK